MTTPNASDPLPLRALQVALGPRTIVAGLPDVTVVRTPTEPGYHEGNALHLRTAPDVGDLDRLLACWRERFGAVPGVGHLRMRWVEPGPRDTTRLREAASLRGLTLDLTAHMELTGSPPARSAAAVDVVPARDARQWHGATVLFRHTDWGGEESFWRWLMAGRRELADTGRGVTYLAYRWGIPVGTASLAWEPSSEVGPHHAGLAVVDDVVVHPAHRGVGIASTLVTAALERHLADHPRALVALRTDDAAGLYERLGFRVRATLGGLRG